MGRHLILIGIGQSGCLTADLFSHKMHGNKGHVTVLGVDTDERSLSALGYACAVPMVDSRSLSAVAEALGTRRIQGWFPCVWDEDHTEFVRSLDMNRGSNQWRMKALLAFASFLSKERAVQKFHAALDGALAGDSDGETEIELCITASLAGGTGSGLFLPIALYVKKYIEQKGYSLSASRALLLMPDIYEHYFTAEQKTKGYANAYAALREYHAVLACTNPVQAEGRDEQTPPMNFRIGDENGALGLLFDSERPEYRDPSANPFDKVYLLERIPNVWSADAHAEAAADAVLSMWNRAPEPVSLQPIKLTYPDAVFGGLSQVKVQYPVDSIVSYISKKQISDCLASEVYHVHKAVTDELGRKSAEARLYGLTFTDNAEEYSRTYISVCEQAAAESGNHLSLIHRDPEIFENEQDPDHVWQVTYQAELFRLADESFDCESFRALDDILYPPVEEEDSDEAGKKRRKKKVRKEKLSPKQLLSQARECGELLLDGYRQGIRRALTDGQAFAERLTPAEAEEGEFSLIHAILQDDGVYFHPALALLRLCLVHRQLSDYCKSMGTEPYLISDLDRLELPDRLIRVDKDDYAVSRYGKLGEERFRTLVFRRDNVSGKLADDQDQFREDLEQVYNKVRGALRAYRFQAVLEVVENLMVRYRRFAETLWKMSEDLAEETRIARTHNSGHGGIVVNVGATEQEKERAYQGYFNLYRKNSEAVSDGTQFMGQCVYEALRKRSAEESVRSAVLSVLDLVGQRLAQQCRDSEFYRDHLEKNIYTVITESVTRKETGVTLPRVFRGRNPWVRVKMPEDFAEYAAVKTVTEAVLDKGTEAFLTESVLSEGDLTAKAYMEELMCKAGESNGEVRFSPYARTDEMRLQTEIGHLRLYFVRALNELGEEPIGYSCYLNALERVDKYHVQMWNPHIVYTRGEALQLPYINPQMQSCYEAGVAKAVLLALWGKELTTERTEDGREIYLLRGDDGYRPILLGDECISADRPADMMLWAYRNSQWVWGRAEKFDRLAAEELAHLPSQAAGRSVRGQAERVMSASRVMTLLGEELLNLIFALDGGFRRYTAEVGVQTLRAYCQKVYGDEFRDHCRGLFNHRMGTWVSAFEAENGREQTNELVLWFSSSMGMDLPRPTSHSL